MNCCYDHHFPHLFRYTVSCMVSHSSFTFHLPFKWRFHEIAKGSSQVVVTEPRALSRQRRIGTREQRGSRRSYDWTEATAPGQRSAVEQPPARPARSWYIDLPSPLLPDSHTFGRLTFILCLHDFSCTYKSGTDPPVFIIHFTHNLVLYLSRTTVAYKQVYYQLIAPIFDITVIPASFDYNLWPYSRSYKTYTTL